MRRHVVCCVFTLATTLALFPVRVLVAQTTGIREVSASPRQLIPLQARVRYTTMVVLPDGEEILDVICGDKDFWIISAAQNMAHIKPAKEGVATNLNLVTTSGTVYSFLLTEKNGASTPDLKVYVTTDGTPVAQPRYFTATQVEGLRAAIPAPFAIPVSGTQVREAIPRPSDLA
jgi:type IV secretion system protein VirB9